MRTLKEALILTFTNVYYLTEQDKAFIRSFGIPGGEREEVTLAEFLEFWNALSEDERVELLLDYPRPDEPLNDIA